MTTTVKKIMESNLSQHLTIATPLTTEHDKSLLLQHANNTSIRTTYKEAKRLCVKRRNTKYLLYGATLTTLHRNIERNKK